ncbi:MAG TPA: hypothetical protein VF230_03980 [Acidimicrobiales bacterium]
MGPGRFAVVIAAAATIAWPAARGGVDAAQSSDRGPVAPREIVDVNGDGFLVSGATHDAYSSVGTRVHFVAQADSTDVDASYVCAANCRWVAAGATLRQVRPPAPVEWHGPERLVAPRDWSRTAVIVARSPKDAVEVRDNLVDARELRIVEGGRVVERVDLEGSPEDVVRSDDGSTAVVTLRHTSRLKGDPGTASAWVVERFDGHWRVRMLHDHRRVLCLSTDGKQGVVYDRAGLFAYDVAADRLGPLLQADSPHLATRAYGGQRAACRVGEGFIVVAASTASGGYVMVGGRVPDSDWLVQRFAIDGSRTDVQHARGNDVSIAPDNGTLVIGTAAGHLETRAASGSRRTLATRAWDAEFLHDGSLVWVEFDGQVHKIASAQVAE